MTNSNLGFTLPLFAVKPSLRALIESSLPENYRIIEREDGSFAIFPIQFDVAIPSNAIGSVREEYEDLVFELDDSSFASLLVQQLKEKYPNYNPDRIVWAVFYEWYGQHAMIGQPVIDKTGLERNLSMFNLERNPILCSFYAGDFDGMSVLTLTYQRIMPDWKVSSVDEGPVLVELSTLEMARGETSGSELFYRDNDPLDLL